VGVSNVAMTLVALRLLGRGGRRTLLMGRRLEDGGLAPPSASASPSSAMLQQSHPVVAIASLMTYLASFANQPRPDLLVAERGIYPLNVRSKTAGIRMMANWTFSLHLLAQLPTADRSARPLQHLQAIRREHHLTRVFCLKLMPETKGNAWRTPRPPPDASVTWVSR
jgi:hypothetical protein